MQAKAYLFCFDAGKARPDEVAEVLDRLPMIEDWIWELPNICLLRSKGRATDLMMAIRDSLRRGTVFFISEIAENSNGCAPPATWEFIAPAALVSDRHDG